MEGLNRAELFKDAQFLQTPEGLLGGTVVLLLFWLLLRLLERWGTSSWSPVIRAVRRPLVLGFGLALFVGWIFGLLAHNLSALTERDVARLTTSIVLIVIGRALIVGGLKFLHSATFNRWLMREIENERERAMMVSLLDRIYSIVIVLVTFAAIMVAFGVSPTAVGAVLGGAGIGIGFGTQQISQNFLSGLMLFFNRPFAEGDWIKVSSFEGTVERIGWYHTRICTFDQRPLFIPNALFATTPIENPGRMYHRRIYEEISLRYEDLGCVSQIVRDVKQMLQQHPAIDQSKTILVNFNQWGGSSINVMIYAFTKTTDWSLWLDQQQDVFLKVADIVKAAGADFAFPSTTLYASPGFQSLQAADGSRTDTEQR